MSKKIGTNIIFNVLRNISNIIFPLITAPYVARVLDPTSLGLANFANSYVSYFVLAAALGIPNYGIREVSKRKGDTIELSHVFSELFSINILTTIVTSILFLSSIFVFDQLRDDYLIFLIAGISLFTSPFSIDWFFSGLEEFQYITMRSIVIKILTIIGLFTFVHDVNDLLIFVLLTVLTSFLNQFWNLVVLLKRGIKINFVISGYRKHLRPLVLLFSSIVAVSLYTTLNTFMLGFMSTYDQVSYYSQANNLSRAFLAVVTSLSEVLVPRLSFLSKANDWNNINRLINQSFSIVSFISFPIGIVIICASPIFVPLFLGSNFYGTILPLQIMSLIIIIIGFNNITAVQILLGLGFDSKLLKSVIWGAFANIVFNCILIPWLGAVGTSISSVVSELLILLVSAIYVSKVTNIKFLYGKELIKSLLGALAFIPLFFIINRLLSGWTLLFVYIITCIIIYYFSQIILKNTALLIVRNYLVKKTSNISQLSRFNIFK